MILALLATQAIADAPASADWSPCPPLDPSNGTGFTVGDVSILDTASGPVVACIGSDLRGNPTELSALKVHVGRPGAAGTTHELVGSMAVLEEVQDGWVLMHRVADDPHTHLAHVATDGHLTRLGSAPHEANALVAHPDSQIGGGTVFTIPRMGGTTIQSAWGTERPNPESSGLQVVSKRVREVWGQLPDGNTLFRGGSGLELENGTLATAESLQFADRPMTSRGSFAFTVSSTLFWQCGDGQLRSQMLSSWAETPELVDFTDGPHGCAATLLALTDNGYRSSVVELKRRATPMAGFPVDQGIGATWLGATELCTVRTNLRRSRGTEWVCQPRP